MTKLIFTLVIMTALFFFTGCISEHEHHHHHHHDHAYYGGYDDKTQYYGGKYSDYGDIEGWEYRGREAPQEAR